MKYLARAPAPPHLTRPGVTSRHPGLVFEVREKLTGLIGPGAAQTAVKRLRRLGSRMEECSWLEAVAALNTVVDLARDGGKTRAELDALVRDFLVGLGSDDPPEVP